MATLKAIRGTRDLLPPETELWNQVEATARAVFARYGFGEIRTPIFESTELFARGVGEETDIVSKEMYTWDDGGRAEITRLQSEWLASTLPRLSMQTSLEGIVPIPQAFVLIERDAKVVFVEFRALPPRRPDHDLIHRTS